MTGLEPMFRYFVSDWFMKILKIGIAEYPLLIVGHIYD